MRRSAIFALCGTLVLGLTCDSLAEARSRARRSRPAKPAKPAKAAKAAKAAKPTKATNSTEPTRSVEPARPTVRLAPRPRSYQLAEPSPEVKLRIKRIRSGANIILYSGYGLSGFGLVSTVTGLVLIGVAQGGTLQTAGIATLITGAITLAGGTAIWAVGRTRMNKADLLLIQAQMRQVQLHDPTQRRPETHALTPPKTHTVFSARLRF